jgi:hypothetical protein
MTIALGSLAWMLWNGETVAAASLIDEGPLRWSQSVTLEGGPLIGTNVFSLKFNGANASQKEVTIKDANLVSAINGTKQTLEIVAQGEIVALDQIELVPPGAPIQLVAKFGPPDPDHPGKILGVDAPTFLATWRQFFLNVEDDTRKYRVTFNEAHLAPLFPGMAGPHVTKKATKNRP